jgi:hypothetical protein
MSRPNNHLRQGKGWLIQKYALLKPKKCLVVWLLYIYDVDNSASNVLGRLSAMGNPPNTHHGAFELRGGIVLFQLFHAIPSYPLCAVYLGHRRRKDRRPQGCARNRGLTKAARQISEPANYFAFLSAHFFTIR